MADDFDALLERYNPEDPVSTNDYWTTCLPILKKIAERVILEESMDPHELINECYESLMRKKPESLEEFQKLAYVIFKDKRIDLNRKRRTKKRGGDLTFINLNLVNMDR